MSRPTGSILGSRYPKRAGRCLIVVLGCSAAWPVFAGDELRVARYTTYRAAPTEAQRDPLSAWVEVRIPSSATTVGAALQHVLRDSGYALADAESASPDRAALLALPLPAVHRNLDPMPLRMVLATIAGPAFQLIEDPIHRLVSFERCTADTEAR